MTAATKTLFLRNLPSGLVREVKAAAARRGKTLTALVEEALTRSLQVEDPPSELETIQDDIAWYARHRTKLLGRYRGEYVAIIDEAVADHDRDYSALAGRVFTRFGNRGVYMPRVQDSEPVVHVRSPRRGSP